MAASKSTPKDAQVMGAILKDMGVNEYEPRLINQMLEFTYRYVTDVLDDAKIYSQHGNKKNIDTDDVKLAIQCKLDHSFTTPPPRDLLMDIARHKNNTPLPLIKPYTGPKLPPDRYCLSQPNYRLRTLKKPRIQLGGTTILPSLSSSQRISLSQSGLSTINKPGGITTMGGTSLSLVTRGVTQPTVTIRPAGASSTGHSGPPVPIIRLTPGSSLSQAPKPIQTITKSLIPTTVDPNMLKRKRDDDEDYDKM